MRVSVYVCVNQRSFIYRRRYHSKKWPLAKYDIFSIVEIEERTFLFGPSFLSEVLLKRITNKIFNKFLIFNKYYSYYVYKKLFIRNVIIFSSSFLSLKWNFFVYSCPLGIDRILQSLFYFLVVTFFVFSFLFPHCLLYKILSNHPLFLFFVGQKRNRISLSFLDDNCFLIFVFIRPNLFFSFFTFFFPFSVFYKYRTYLSYIFVVSVTVTQL